MTAAARAKARAEEIARAKAEAEAQAASDFVAKAKPRKAAARARPAPAVPAPLPGHTSPAARRRAFLIASSAGRVLAASGISADMQADNDDDIVLDSDVAKVVLQLQADRARLKAFKATERKVEAKREMLPFYRPWADGVLSAGDKAQRGALDAVFTTIMAWTIDTGDYLAALPMLEHAVTHGLDMPSGFNRDPITFAIDQVCDDALAIFDTGDAAAINAFPAAVLPMLEDLVVDHDADLHDDVEAKLKKTMARAILAGTDLENEEDLRKRREQALKLNLRALELCAKVGVKKDIEKLQRELKRTAPPPPAGGEQTQPPAGGDTDTPPGQDG